jgi:hypothetical protein
MPDSAVVQANEILHGLEARFRSQGEPVEVKFRELCSAWPWAKRSDVLTHLIHSYSAKILPYIPILFLSSDTYIEPDAPVADIFAGTGTVLLESSVHPFYPRTAYGVELNPLARLVAQVKITPLETAHLTSLAEDIVAVASGPCRAEIPAYTQLDYWFPPESQAGLGQLRWAIEHHVRHPAHRDFFRVCLAATVRKCSFADPDIPPPVRLNPAKYPPASQRRHNAEKRLEELRRQDPIRVFRRMAARNIERMERFCLAWKNHPSPKQSQIVWDDATCLRWADVSERAELTKATSRPFPSNSCGAIITSPPYGTAQKYVRNTKLEMLWLGLIREQDIADLDRRTIGTEKALKTEYTDIPRFPNAAINQALRLVADRSLYRAALTYKYFQGMQRAMLEAHRILRIGGHLIIVIGDNTVSGISVQNHRLLASLAQEIGFTVRMILSDRLDSRGMITTRHHTGGLVTHDWVVVLKK